MRSRRHVRRLFGTGGSVDGSLAEAKESLLEALQGCQIETERLGKFTPEGRREARKIRKIMAAIALVDEVKGARTLPGDPDLVSEEEAARRAQLQREERERAEKAKAAAAEAAASPNEV